MVIFPDDHQNQPANNMNTQRYNPSLLNHRDILIVVLYINISLLLRTFLHPTWENASSCLQFLNPDRIIETNNRQ